MDINNTFSKEGNEFNLFVLAQALSTVSVSNVKKLSFSGFVHVYVIVENQGKQVKSSHN